MDAVAEKGDGRDPPSPLAAAEMGSGRSARRYDWRTMMGMRSNGKNGNHNDRFNKDARDSSSETEGKPERRTEKWSLGILNDRETEEVPGSILLLSKASEFNEPLGLQSQPARASVSSLPSQSPISRSSSRRRYTVPETKRTSDGKFILEPQPDDSANDPLNWSLWRRDAALLSLGLYCMLGGGMTPILAAGFHQVAMTYDVSVPEVALTTGLYMAGMGVGSVLLSPTAILFGKRPVYLVAAICFVLASVWCALSPDYPSLVVARIFQGMAVSSVECLPSATVAEIYFLHEKAYRLGIYTLLLLGGKNLVPLVSAAIIGSLGWRWVFWIVAIVVGFAGCLLFLFVPETFWDRSPVPPKPRKRPSFRRLHSLAGSHRQTKAAKSEVPVDAGERQDACDENAVEPLKKPDERHIHFGRDSEDEKHTQEPRELLRDIRAIDELDGTAASKYPKLETPDSTSRGAIPRTPHSFQSTGAEDYFSAHGVPRADPHDGTPSMTSGTPAANNNLTSPISRQLSATELEAGLHTAATNPYTRTMRKAPPRTFVQQLRPYSGRINHVSWFKAMIRPFILYAYPSILWSAMVYSLSIGWLIVLSESVATIFEDRDMYNFTALQTGLVYISPFIGGVLGTAVAGKVSDLVVRWLARKNGGIYEPEFRLVMAIPILITTSIGLMGYGWSTQEKDSWIVPTVFFGFISFGCSLGSTTSITFAVDSYRQYAGEALVTLNFSKNIFHGLVFSLFFNRWLDADGPRDTFIAIGGIQVACLLFTIPMYIYGKRCRMWTVRKNLMEKF